MSRVRMDTKCRQAGCPTRVVFATRDGKTLPYEAEDRLPFSENAVGCHVLVDGTAWKPAELIEQFMVRFSCDEDRARAAAAGHPFHRPHFHDPDELPPPKAAEKVAQVIQGHRFQYANEDALQRGLYEAFAAAGFAPSREVHLGQAGRIDFLIDVNDTEVGVEVKVDGSVETVERQLARYAPSVDELVLVTTQARHRDVFDTAAGKPVTVILIRGAAW